MREAAGDRLMAWAEQSGHRRVAEPGRGALRFTFYGGLDCLDGGLSGSGHVTSAAAGSGWCAGGRSRVFAAEYHLARTIVADTT